MFVIVTYDVRIINIERDFREREDGAVLLSTTGKRIFLGEFYNKLYQKITEKNRPITYDTRIKHEVKKLCNYFMNGEKYRPYKYIN